MPTYFRVTLERLNQLEPWISPMAEDFDEAKLKAETDEINKHAKDLLADVEKEQQHEGRLRLKDDDRHRSRHKRRSRSRERDR